MKLLFIDETGDAKDKDYLGFSLALMDAKFYASLKTKACKILDDVEWDREVEFKGAYLFSQTKGCSEVEVGKRVEAAGKLLDLNAGKDARMKFSYGSLSSKDKGADYLRYAPALIEKSLPKASSGAGKI